MNSLYTLAAGIAIVVAATTLMHTSSHNALSNMANFRQRVQWTVYGGLLSTCLIFGGALIVYSILPQRDLKDLLMIVPMLGFGATLIMLSLTEPQGTWRNVLRGLVILIFGIVVLVFTTVVAKNL